MELPGINHKRSEAKESRKEEGGESEFFGKKLNEEKTGQG